MKTNELRKVYIIGGPGSGKTYLAKRFARVIGCEHIDLDRVAYERSRKRPLHERAQIVRTISEKPNWVVEGIYSGWTQILIERADAVLWLDLSPSLALLRIVRRHISASVRGENEYKGILHLFKFILWSYWNYAKGKGNNIGTVVADDSANNRATTAIFLAPYADKVHRLGKSRDVRVVVQELEN